MSAGGPAPASPSPSALAAPAWLSPTLAGVAGFVDTTGFVLFAGVFMAHVTGNFVVLGATVSGQEHGSTAAKLAVLPLFILGVALGWFILRGSAHRGPRRVALAQSICLFACAGLGAWGERLGSMPLPIELASISFGIIAMGLQSMLTRSLKLPMTHVMTGNVTQLTADVLDSRSGRAESWASARKNVALVACFAGGALLAGVLITPLGPAGLAIPAMVVLGIAWALK